MMVMENLKKQLLLHLFRARFASRLWRIAAIGPWQSSNVGISFIQRHDLFVS
ncbi:hypothetical protein Hdeb2414_s0012g00378791 [Helianthus debilis subsp. tardiflorus]